MKALVLTAATALAGAHYVVSPAAKADVIFGSLTPTPACGAVSGVGSVCGINETFTVRRISYGEGVERVFPLHSPRIAKVEVEKEGRARRAKLNYLRTRKGKEATAVRE